jgi:hypothetical protein
MPAKSAKQEKFMRAVAHSPSFAKKVGVPMSVGREFSTTERDMKKTVKKMALGGAAMGAIKKAVGAKAPPKGPSGMPTFAKSAAQNMMQQAKARPAPPKGPSGMPTFAKSAAQNMMQQAKARPAGRVMASGGLAAGHKAADGIAKKGKTKAMQVKMASGGKTKKYC